MQECSRCGCSGQWEGLADARREAVAAASLGCEEMAGAADVPLRSSCTRPLACSQQEDKEGFEKINTRPGKVQGMWWGRAEARCGAVRCGVVWQHLSTVSPPPRSSSSPRLASRARNGRSGVISPMPRPGSSHTPSPSESSEAGRRQQQGEDVEGGLGLLRSPCRGWWPGPSLGLRSDRSASANYCGCRGRMSPPVLFPSAPDACRAVGKGRISLPFAPTPLPGG